MLVKKLLIITLVLIFAGAVLSRNAIAADYVDSSVSYKLPYPGILPDSPLYFIKDLRDKAVALLVMGPVNKSFYNLLMADKRLLAGQMLIEAGNSDLGSRTLLEAEEYYTVAAKEANEAAKQGANVSELGAKLLVSSSKHEEVLTAAISRVSGKALDNVSKAASLNQKARSQVMHLSTSK